MFEIPPFGLDRERHHAAMQQVPLALHSEHKYRSNMDWMFHGIAVALKPFIHLSFYL